MNPMGISALVLVAVGVLLILLGAWMSLKEWNKARFLKIQTEPKALDDTLEGLAKLLEALKSYPAGQKLIVFGIVILIIAGIFGGVSGL
jgi:hypothetical protein